MTSPGNPASEHVRELVAECLERVQEEGPGAIARICASHPELEPLVRRRLERLRDIGMATLDEAFPERLGDFRLLARLGGGGMGVVYRARQESLQREVALKVVRGDQIYFPKIRERFRREVESVARVAHPGIVAIHTVGEQDGVPFFAMELVHGITLQQLLHCFDGRDPRTLSGHDVGLALAAHGEGALDADQSERVFGRSWVEVSFRIVLQAALALQHAHENAVLHRDLKPSNLMVTATGRVVLLDFGLADIQGQSKLTQTGVQIGSLPYQAPELVEERPNQDGARADVYSLGVTLYELLTLRSPFLGKTSSQTRHSVLHGGPRRVGELNPAVPWDAETVCLAAIERDPARRYASAKALADDLRACLDLRPIAARRAGLALRARRWVQRHPARALALCVVLLAGLVLPTVVAIVEHDASTRIGLSLESERKASARADQERRRAERNLRHARSAVDSMLFDAGEGMVHDFPQTEPFRKKVLLDAKEFYEHFLTESEGAEELRFEVVTTTQVLGSLLRRIGERQRAVETLRRGVGLGEKLVAEEHGSPAARDALARCWVELGVTDFTGGNDSAAETSWLRGRDELVAAAVAAPTDARILDDLCDCVQNLGMLHASGGDLELAERELTATLQMRLHIRELPADGRDRTSPLAAVCSVLGSVAEQRRRFADALRCHETAASLQREAHVSKDVIGIRRDLARYVSNVGRIRVLGKKTAEAEEAFREAVALRERIVAEAPHDGDNFYLLADTLMRLYDIALRRGDPAARPLCERAVEAARKAAELEPTENRKQYVRGLESRLASLPEGR